MNNIKITPYPNFHISDECLERDVKANSVKVDVETGNEAANDLRNVPHVMVTEFADGKKRVVRNGPAVSNDDNKYFAVFPNPVHLFLSHAIDVFNRSENIKQTSFPLCASETGKKIGGVNFLNADADETHDCYNNFLKMRMNSIIMLCTAVEAFMNHSIPNNYPGRERIERYARFSEKLTEHLPASLNLNIFWDDKQELQERLLSLNGLRNDIVHLKTNSMEGFEAYFAVMDAMVARDLEQAITDVKSFMNAITQDFIKEQE